MTHTEVKRQHFVPRTYLKNFATKKSDEYYIHALPISEPKIENVFELNITKVCLERNLYTLPGNNSHERMLLETFYATELEQHYEGVYQLLIDPNNTVVNKEQRERIILTVITMLYRTTFWINEHNDILKRTLTLLFEACKETGKDYFIAEGEKISIANKTLEQIISENKVESKPTQVLLQLETAFKLFNHRKETDAITILKIVEDNCELITSDNPVIMQNEKLSKLMPFDPTNILKLPLDRRHMLILTPRLEHNDLHSILRQNISGESTNLNSSQFEKAERFVLGDNNALNNYLSK